MATNNGKKKRPATGATGGGGAGQIGDLSMLSTNDRRAAQRHWRTIGQSFLALHKLLAPVLGDVPGMATTAPAEISAGTRNTGSQRQSRAA